MCICVNIYIYTCVYECVFAYNCLPQTNVSKYEYSCLSVYSLLIFTDSVLALVIIKYCRRWKFTWFVRRVCFHFTVTSLWYKFSHLDFSQNILKDKQPNSLHFLSTIKKQQVFLYISIFYLQLHNIFHANCMIYLYRKKSINNRWNNCIMCSTKIKKINKQKKK